MSSNRAIGTILIVALSGFLMGFDGSLFTGAVVYVKGTFALTNLEVGWAVVSHTFTAPTPNPLNIRPAPCTSPRSRRPRCADAW